MDGDSSFMGVAIEAILRIKDLSKTKRRYVTFLADPPWRYKRNQTEAKGERSMFDRKLPYTSMSLADICMMPIERLAEEDAMLWLWATNVMLQEGLDVMDAWGFKYVGIRTWAKPRIGVGYWLRGQTEQLLLGIRGKPNRQDHYNPASINKGLSTLLRAPVGKHSAKPPESYRDIELVSKTPRLELFARRARQGWDSWGNEAQDASPQFAKDMEKYV